MRVLACALLAVSISSCFWSRSVPVRETVEELEVLSFAERIEVFYRTLEQLPLDVSMTYQDARIRSHFENEETFADYYASLADQVRGVPFRNGRAEKIEIVQFYFEDPELARVEVQLQGRHQRALRFWKVELRRLDTWRLLEGAWLLTPEKL